MPHLERHTRLFHVGDLEGSRTKPSFSYDGRGLSVSKAPETWRDIAAGVAGKTYELRNDDAVFVQYAPTEVPTRQQRQWCRQQGFVVETTGYEVLCEDGRRFVFTDRDTAMVEADEPGRTWTETTTVELGKRGVAYWETAFTTPPEQASPLEVVSLLPVWYVQNAIPAPVDGIWIDYKNAPVEYSCPCGMIWQKLVFHKNTIL